ACPLRPAIRKVRGRTKASFAKRLHEGLCYGRVAQRAPMTVWKKMSQIGAEHVVEVDADIRKLAKDRRGKIELWFEKIAGALMGQDHSHAVWHFFSYLTEDEADDLDRLSGIIRVLGSRRLNQSCDDRSHAGPVAPAFPQAEGRPAEKI